MDYTASEKLYIFLDQFDISDIAYAKLFECYGTSEELKVAIFNGEKNAKQILGEKYNTIKQNFNKTYIESTIENLNKKNVKIVTIESEGYPELLKQIDNPPKILYCLGDVNLLKSKCISIVGMRKVSDRFAKLTNEFAHALSNVGFTIVSGMADGVDGIAHKAALKLNNPTIAVLAGGFEYIYPKNHFDMFKKICKTGLVICEHRPSVEPLPYRFIRRNRIVAGLSPATLVTCAAENSGTFSTANFAVDFGRELFVVPGDIDCNESMGTNKMIKQFNSAAVTNCKDILHALGYQVNDAATQKVDRAFDKRILDCLKSGKKHFRELLHETNILESDLISSLSILEIKGKVIRLAQNYFEINI